MLKTDPNDRTDWDLIVIRIDKIAKNAKLRVREIACSL